MFKRHVVAIIVAFLTTFGIIVSPELVDKAISIVVPRAQASMMTVPYELSMTTVEALRPSYLHFRGYRYHCVRAPIESQIVSRTALPAASSVNPTEGHKVSL